MRTLTRSGRTLAYTLSGGLVLVGCLSLQDISLGELALDAGDSRRAPADAGPITSLEASSNAPVDAAEPDAKHDDDDDDEDDDQRPLDAGVVPDTGGVDAASAINANNAVSTLDAGGDAHLDAAGADASEAERPLDAAMDSGDAAPDATATNPLCDREPWHCL